ncbi:MAG TPA: hypothetical protein VMV21_08610, partial [Vicinamibacteria bacterium]|nr:hypothetical protein [Vicinamibacteria bacterium]
GLPHAALLSVSPQGQLAILLDPHRQMGLFSRGTLATVPMGGGAPHEVLPDVNEADWAPDGQSLAVLRYVQGEQQIEFPLGDGVYRSRKGLRLLRVSPDGRRLAFIEGTESQLELVALEIGTRRASILADHLPSNLFGLAWAAASREVWITVGESAAARDVVAIGLDGRRRLVYRSLTTASLLDLAADGRALLLRGTDRWGTMTRVAGEGAEQDLSVFDFSVPTAVSPDGRTLLVNEFGQAAGPGGAVFVRHAGTPAVRLSEGLGLDLTLDGSAALVKSGQPPQLLDVPTGPSLPRKVSLGSVSPRWARWVPPAGARIVVLGQEPGRPQRLFVVDRGGTSLRPLGPESGVSFFAVSPDGSSVAVRSSPGSVSLLPIDGGTPREIPGVADDLSVGSFSGDGKSLFLVRTSVAFPCEVHRLDLSRGQTTLFKRVAPADPTGISECSWMNLSTDGESYAYAFHRSYADLILAEGLR